MSGSSDPATVTSYTPGVEPMMYAVIDLAVCKQLRPVITRLTPAASETLFSRSLAPELLEVGPWLVQLTKVPEVELALAELGEEVPWGYYIYSTIDILSLRKSLRRYNLVKIPNPHREVLFRYWDPRVMRTLLKVTTKFQRERLFEWIDHIDVAGDSFYGDQPIVQ